MTEDKVCILVGDLGGTNLRLEARIGGATVLSKRYTDVASFGGLDQIVSEALNELDRRPVSACFAVAGLVDKAGRSAEVTNLGWHLSAERLEGLGISSVRLINDFEAIAMAIPSLALSEVIQVGGGPRAVGDAVVLGPGTGLGVAFLCWTGSDYLARPGETGHREWPARTEAEWRIRCFIAQSKGQSASGELGATSPTRVSFEDVISGPGLVNLYTALLQTQYGGRATALSEAISRSPRAAPGAVADAARDGDAVAQIALGLFFDALAVLASDLALQKVPAGVYIAGGIIPRNLSSFLRSGFRDTFDSKAPHESLMRSTPVFVITTDKELGVEGAAVKALSLL